MIKRICVIILILFSVLLSSCDKEKSNCIENIVGEWYLEYFGGMDYPDINAVFNSDYTGTFTREDGSKSWLFTWSYDEKADCYLIYRANDEYVRCVKITEEDGVVKMHFDDFVGTKSE